MWTLKSIEVSKNAAARLLADRVKMQVLSVFVNGEEETVLEFYASTKEEMDLTLISIIERLNTLDKAIASIKVGEGYEPKLPVAPEPPVIPEPTEEELANAARAEKIEELRRLKDEQSLGIISDNDVARLESLVTELKR